MNAFNMPRDSFYLQNDVRIILLLNQQEYDMFLNEYGDSYAHIREDIDSIIGKGRNSQNIQENEDNER